MSAFRIVEHQVPGQHVREYRQATAHSQEDILYLCVKQYIPIDNPNPKPGDITIIGAHANGFPKELYEPLWDDLLEQSGKQGWRIRSIWMADAAHQGQSGIMNERLLGNDPSWHDHTRDLLHLINLKRDEMPRPIVGIGHSMGGAQLVYLSFMHPRLITSLVLLDPTIHGKMQYDKPSVRNFTPAKNLAQLSTFRRDKWPSREAAADSYNKSAFYQAWDRRVLQKWNEFGLRDVPTLLYPDSQPPEVTLTTPVAHEVFTYVRPNYNRYGANGKPINRVTHADVEDVRGPFYRPEAPQSFRHLPELRPSALFIFGGTSPVSTREMNEERLEISGTGVGGSGGRAEGRVKGVTFEGVGHLVPMEAASRTAEVAAEWIGEEIRRVREEEMEWRRGWEAKSLREKQEIDEVWKETVGGPPKRGAKM